MSLYLRQILMLVESITIYSSIMPVLYMEKWKEKLIYLIIHFHGLRKCLWVSGNGSVSKGLIYTGAELITITIVKSQE